MELKTREPIAKVKKIIIDNKKKPSIFIEGFFFIFI